MVTTTQAPMVKKTQQGATDMNDSQGMFTTIQFEDGGKYMNDVPMSLIVPPSGAEAFNGTIVRNENGVNIEESLRNVSQMARSWYKSSSRQLYAVLGQCYELYYLIEKAKGKQRDTYRDEVKAAYKALNGAQGANTLLGRVVSVVFNFVDLDRRQRSRYGSVIKAAFEAQRQPHNAESFVSWLDRTGGIVAALDTRSKKATDKVEQGGINEVVRSMPAIATLEIANTNKQFVVLLAEPVDESTVRVLYQFEDDALGDLLATKAYKAEKKATEHGGQKQSAAAKADQLATLKAAGGVA